MEENCNVAGEGLSGPLFCVSPGDLSENSDFYRENTPRCGFWFSQVASYLCLLVLLVARLLVKHRQLVILKIPYLPVASL